MPSDETLLEQAEEWKRKGNEHYQKGNVLPAITAYSQGIVLCDRILSSGGTATTGTVSATTTVASSFNANPSSISSTASSRVVHCKATLLSNRAMCHLKVLQFPPVIEDCSTALALEPTDTTLRCKIWYRRAKARFLLSSSSDTTTSETSSPGTLLQEAAKDLLQLLQADGANTEAQKLLATIRAVHHQTRTATTPLRKTLDALIQSSGGDGNFHDGDAGSANDERDVPTTKKKASRTVDEEECLKQIKILLGLIDDDAAIHAMELGRIEDGIPKLFRLTKRFATMKMGILLLQCISRAAAHPAFVQRYLKNYQQDIYLLIEMASFPSSDDRVARPSSEFIVSALAALTRIILHADRDDPNLPIEATSTTVVEDTVIVKSCIVALDGYPNDKLVLRAVLDVISTWTCGTEREMAARAILGSVVDPTLPIPKTPADIRSMTPHELAAHRKREADKNKRDATWAVSRAKLFTMIHDTNTTLSGLRTLTRAACRCDDHVVRREIAVVIGRLLAALEGNDPNATGDIIKERVGPLLGKPKTKNDTLTIEEVYNEDEEEKVPAVETECVPLETKMERALVTAALLLSKKDVGAWALGTGWGDSTDELPDLIHSENPVAMCLASEVLSGASTVESARYIVANLVSGGAMEKLLMSEDRDIRSGAASAVTKLGLADKEADEGERVGLLSAACDLLEDRKESEQLSKVAEKLQRFNNFAGSSVERAIEMLTYIVANTAMKEEIVGGFQSPGAPTTALERLVALADVPHAGESISGYGLASIFHSLAVTNLQLRKEAFEGRDVTMEQYDEFQKLGKTEEEKEILETQKDSDTEEMCHARIRKMASVNVPRALVNLMEGASEHTLEQLVLALSRFASEPSARGSMIQQGVLSALIKIEKNEGPTETDTMKKIIRIARHSIARTLITTNPGLLTSAQRLGSIRPLVLLVRDIHASDLQHFESLLALTNLASSGEDAQNRIVSERGIAALHYVMFSDHEMVRRAATEAMCNLVPHEAMMSHLAEGDHLKMWFAFATDYEENYECARAATGCLAMATYDERIATKLVELEKFRQHTHTLLECGRLEIMHRAMVLLHNLVRHQGKIKEKVVKEGIVSFCEAYVITYNNNEHPDKSEFSDQERALLPVTVDLAKKIVKDAEEA